MLKRNLIANYFGQGWSALMGFAFVPYYIKYLGIEAYGMIGVFAVMQVWLSLLDMGMSAALNREFARFSGNAQDANYIKDLLRSMEVLAVCMGGLVAVIIFAASGWIATRWISTDNLTAESVTRSISMIGMVIGLRFTEGVYRSTLIGLQRQVLYNVVSSSMATLRGAGAIVALVFVGPTLEVFFLWQFIMSVLTLGILLVSVYFLLPETNRRPKFSKDALWHIKTFAGGFLGLTILNIILTQIDKVLLIKLISLSEFGYYTLAVTVTGALNILNGAAVQAFYPRLCELHARGEDAEFADTYHRGAQLVTVLFGSAVIILILRSSLILQLWTQDADLVERVAPLISILAFGNLLNGLMWIPFQAQLAVGWISLMMRTNLVCRSADRSAYLVGHASLRAYRGGLGLGVSERYLCVNRHSLHAPSPAHRRKMALVFQ